VYIPGVFLEQWVHVLIKVLPCLRVTWMPD
jgi:hypothetical protein